jgi:hypothetical protein
VAKTPTSKYLKYRTYCATVGFRTVAAANPIIVYAGGYFEIFETLRFVQMVLQLSPPVQEHLRAWLAEHLNQIQKRE